MKEPSLEIMKQLFGDAVEEQIQEKETASPEVWKFVEDVAVDQIWSRKGLDLKQKSLVTISSQIALERWDQVELHMGSYLHLGGRVAELREVVIHLSIYCGFPVMIRASEVLNKVTRE